MNPRFLAGLALMVGVVLWLPLVGAEASTTHDIIFESDHTEVPEQTVTFEGDEYSITAIGLAEPDGEFTVTVEADGTDAFDLYLYNKDNEIEAVESDMVAGEQATFDADSLSGTYMLMVNSGSTEALAPVVVKAYDVTDPEVISPDNEITDGEDVNVRTTLTELDSEPISHVELVVWDGSSQERIEMTDVDEDTYEATVADVDAGEYVLYVTVHGYEEIEGEGEMIAVSHSSAFQVSESDEESDSGVGGGGTGGEGASDDEPTETPTDATETSIETTETPGEDTETPTDTATEDSSVLTPNERTETAAEPTSSEGPLSPALAVIAVILAGLVVLLRQ